MWVYKITNIINNKVYIGQTIRPVEKRIRRHFNDAIKNKLDTHFARAIRKYGTENFVWEIIDEAKNQEELNKKEQYWIKYYDSVNTGYNETDAIDKCGGNTYQSKTKEELKEIGEKIKESKLGGKNPNSKTIVMKNIITKEEKEFSSMQECADYLNLASHMPISRRCRGVIKVPLNNTYVFYYK